jgi:hypothetical protein
MGAHILEEPESTALVIKTQYINNTRHSAKGTKQGEDCWSSKTVKLKRKNRGAQEA